MYAWFEIIFTEKPPKRNMFKLKFTRKCPLAAAFIIWNFTLYMSLLALNQLSNGYNDSLGDISKTSISRPLEVEKPQQKYDANISVSKVIYSNSPRLASAWKKVPFLNSLVLPRILTQEKTDSMLRLIRNMTSMFRELGIEHIMCQGTLLGSYVSHSILPWDDDLDIFIHLKHAPKLRVIAKRKGLLSKYGLDFIESCQGRHKTTNQCILPKYKVWWLNSSWKAWTPWSMPFIDIPTYNTNNTHVWFLDPLPWVLPIATFYPLRMRPLNGLWLPAPREPYAILSTHYRSWREEHAMVGSCKFQTPYFFNNCLKRNI